MRGIKNILKMKGEIKLIVLYLIKKKPRSSYDLKKDVVELYGRIPSNGTIYPLLGDLLLLKLVSSKKDKRKIMYSITKEGKEELNRLKLFFFNKLERMIKFASILDSEVLR